MASFVIRTVFRVYNPASYGAKWRKTEQADEKWGVQCRAVGIAGSSFRVSKRRCGAGGGLRGPSTPYWFKSFR